MTGQSALLRRHARHARLPSGPMDPRLWVIASVALRSVVLIGIAMLLIFVLLPAVLGAQSAAAL